MPKFVYVGDPGRVYPQAPVQAPEVGVAYDLDADPGDGRWKSAKQDPKPAAK